MDSNGKRLHRAEFPKPLQKTVMTKTAFRTCDSVPFDEDNIQYSKSVKQKVNKEHNYDRDKSECDRICGIVGKSVLHHHILKE